MSDTVIYRAKIGLWVYLNLFIIVFNLLTTGCIAVSDGRWWQWFPFMIMVFCGVSLLLQLVFLAYYTIDGKNKWIRSGPCRLLEIEKIRKITENSDLISSLTSPTWSLDRLEITYNKYDTVCISPKEKAKFLRHLLSIKPDIELKLKSKAMFEEFVPQK
ncbi:MAG: PH domain-containing protein [Planctomycetaceae bacterium]|nr:PH domain-containing protein [Planctomycetaceae bacterium]